MPLRRRRPTRLGLESLEPRIVLTTPPVAFWAFDDAADVGKDSSVNNGASRRTAAPFTRPQVTRAAPWRWQMRPAAICRLLAFPLMCQRATARIRSPLGSSRQRP